MHIFKATLRKTSTLNLTKPIEIKTVGRTVKFSDNDRTLLCFPRFVFSWMRFAATLAGQQAPMSTFIDAV